MKKDKQKWKMGKGYEHSEEETQYGQREKGKRLSSMYSEYKLNEILFTFVWLANLV